MIFDVKRRGLRAECPCHIKMANELAELAEWIDGLGSMAKDLAHGEDLLRGHEERYAGIARRVGMSVLMAMPPEGMDASEWSLRVHEFGELIGSRMDAKAMEIFYNGRMAGDASGVTAKEISYTDVEAWVEAGLEGQDGKQVTDEELAESEPGDVVHDIANRVYGALTSEQTAFGFAGKDYSGIRQVLGDWVGTHPVDNLDAMLDSVLAAWAVALEPVIERDMEDWAREMCGW